MTIWPQEPPPEIIIDVMSDDDAGSGGRPGRELTEEQYETAMQALREHFQGVTPKGQSALLVAAWEALADGIEQAQAARSEPEGDR
jgi:hypothetical protein